MHNIEHLQHSYHRKIIINSGGYPANKTVLKQPLDFGWVYIL